VSARPATASKPPWSAPSPRDAHEAVKRWFVDRGAHGASDFRVIPYGEAKPVATNSTAEGRRKNRRVVINASWGL
jgi:flagellar motor protein MotB